MEMSLSEQLTYSTVRLVCSNGQGDVSLGTGFIMSLCRHGSEEVPVIITNRHVVSDYSKFEFEFCLKKIDGKPDDLNVNKITLENVTWFNHPNKNVDLCCLPFAAVLKEARQKEINLFYIPLGIDSLPSKEMIEQLSAMEEVIMVGYPIGLIDNYNHKPIIRRGITATHIKKKYCGKNEFLVDMACFPGSSGSPVCILNEGTYLYNNNVCIGTRFLLVGILYAGPQFDVEGNITFSQLPTIKTAIPTNLGLVIRSDELLQFESLFNILLKFNSSNN